MKALCDANCDECILFNKQCKGCKNTNGCPFGKKCWIAKYIEVGGVANYNLLQKDIINDFNSLNIDGMPKINQVYPLHGSFINLEYNLPNNKKQKFINDNEAYLGTQVECEFNDGSTKRFFGLLANMSFLLVCEYNEDLSNPELIIYKKR